VWLAFVLMLMSFRHPGKNFLFGGLSCKQKKEKTPVRLQASLFLQESSPYKKILSLDDEKSSESALRQDTHRKYLRLMQLEQLEVSTCVQYTVYAITLHPVSWQRYEFC
jgi:hypothetical protein